MNSRRYTYEKIQRETRVIVTIEWSISTNMYWSRNMEPPESRIEDAIADTTPGSVLEVEDLQIEEPEWTEDESSWKVTGTVETKHSQKLKRAVGEVSKEDAVSLFDWIQNTPLRGVKYFTIEDVACKEIVTKHRPVNLITELEFEEMLKTQSD